VKVAEPVFWMFSATMMPSVGWMSPEVWILMVMVLFGGKRWVSEEMRGGKGQLEGKNAHPLDGLSQVSVSGWPAVAWMPEAGFLTTLLPPPWAATRAAKARTRGTQGRMLIDCLP
jgi:hypothetical protein